MSDVIEVPPTTPDGTIEVKETHQVEEALTVTPSESETQETVAQKDGEDDETTKGVKRGAPEDRTRPQGNGDNFKRPRQEREPIAERDLPTIQKQLEYYFSDQNLQGDEFFYKMIKEDPEGALPIEKLLSCRKLSVMKADEALITEAANASQEIECHGSGIRRKGNKALPEFVGRPERPPRRQNERAGRTGHGSPGGRDRKPNKNLKPVVLHQNGLVMKVSGLREDDSWENVSKAINTLMGDLFVGVKTPKGDDAKPVNFCGNKSSKGEVHMLLSPMEDDRAKLSQLKEVEMDGEKFPLSIEDDQAAGQAFFKSLPRMMSKKLTPPLFNPKIVFGSGAVEFASADHLRKCCKELLEVTPIGTDLSGPGAEVLTTLVKMHPDPYKSAGLKTVKVALHPNSSPNNEMRSFFAVKENGGEVDFSYLKCLNEYLTHKIEETNLALRSSKTNEDEKKIEEVEETKDE